MFNSGMDGAAAVHGTKSIAAEAKTAYFEGDTAGRPAQPAKSDPTMVTSVSPTRPILIKRYAGRRFYRPDVGAYLTLDDIAVMVEDETDFMILEADSGTDITSSILQITRKRALHG